MLIHEICVKGTNKGKPEFYEWLNEIYNKLGNAVNLYCLFCLFHENITEYVYSV